MGTSNVAMRETSEAHSAVTRIKDHWSALGSFKRSRRYRLAQLLGEPLDRWRRRSDS
jgi:hypothetical protein